MSDAQTDSCLERKTVSHDELRAYMWRSGDLRWKLDELQLKIKYTIADCADAKSVCVLSSRQIGKSYLAAVLGIEYAITHPGTIVRIIAPTLKQCADIVNDNLTPICADAPKGFIERSKSEYRWTIGQSSLRLGSLDRANVDANRGGNASLIIYEECGFVKGDDFLYGVNSVLGPQLLRSNGSEWYISSPSEQPDHPLHTEVLPRCQLLGTAFQFSVFDSPSVTRAMIDEAIRRCGGEDTDAFRREYLAQIIRPKSLMVVPDFDRKRHVDGSVDLPQHHNPGLTIDWGGARDKTVALFHTYDFAMDRDLVLDELVFPANTATDSIVRDLRDLERRYGVDPIRTADLPGQVQVDLANIHDYHTRLPPKEDWRAGVNSMAVKFSMDKIAIHPRCKFLIQTCESGMFNPNRTDFARTEALGHCDALAALMYAIRSQNRESPWSHDVPPRDNMFALPRKSDDVKFADAVQPKSFAASFNSTCFRPKRFGTFKR